MVRATTRTAKRPQLPEVEPANYAQHSTLAIRKISCNNVGLTHLTTSGVNFDKK